jgi:hypothetical protein
MPDELTREELLTKLRQRRAWPVSRLASVLDCHVSTVYRWLYEGHVEAERLGPARTYILTGSLVKYLDELQEKVG